MGKQTGKTQARAPATQFFDATAFAPTEHTIIRWLGLAGFFINCRGFNFMVDPVLLDFDMPLLIDIPVKPSQIRHLDAVFITHSDNDHFSIPTCTALAPVTDAFHSTRYVDSLMKPLGLRASGHGIGESFDTGNVKVTTTPADHAWQNAAGGAKRVFEPQDACGFIFNTPDGTIWAPGDSRLMQSHLTLPAPDAIFFDFSDNEWHFGLYNAAKLANAYPDSSLLLCHWGSVDAPDFTPFNGDPDDIRKLIVNPERARILAPGEPFMLRRTK